MLVKLEQNRMVETIDDFDLSDKNGLPFLTKC